MWKIWLIWLNWLEIFPYLAMQVIITSCLFLFPDKLKDFRQNLQWYGSSSVWVLMWSFILPNFGTLYGQSLHWIIWLFLFVSQFNTFTTLYISSLWFECFEDFMIFLEFAWMGCTRVFISLWKSCFEITEHDFSSLVASSLKKVELVGFLIYQNFYLLFKVG